MITTKNYNVALAKLPDKKLMFEFAKEMNFDGTAFFYKSTGDKTLIKLPKARAIMAGSLKKRSLKTNGNEQDFLAILMNFLKD